MTATLKATHRGTCQACGRAQAHFKGTIAKHGYTVDWGYFHGVCRGAERLPLEQDKSITEATIKNLLEQYAPQADKLAADLRSGAVEPQFYNSRYDRVTGKQEKTFCTRAELKFEFYQTQEDVAKRQIAAAVHMAEQDARYARSHAAMLEKLIAARHGQPLMPIAKRVLQVGDRVNRGSKKRAMICEVTELRYERVTGCGPHLNGQRLLHAILKREDDGCMFAVPTRLIRAASIVEGGAQ